MQTGRSIRTGWFGNLIILIYYLLLFFLRQLTLPQGRLWLVEDENFSPKKKPTFIIFENATIKAKKFAKICEQLEMPTFRVQSKKI